MPEHHTHFALTLEEREASRLLWHALMFPASSAQTKTARTQLSQAAVPIQQAVIHEIVNSLRKSKPVEVSENPFEFAP